MTAISATLRRLCLAALLAAPVLAAAPHAALAQHVVTEDEAAKLNFDSLTAAPAYHAPVVQHVAYRSHTKHGHVVAARGARHTRSASRDGAMVQFISARHTVNTSRAHGHHRRG